MYQRFTSNRLQGIRAFVETQRLKTRASNRLGAMAEIVEDGRTGLLFEPGNPEDLAEKVAWAWTHPKEMEEMGREARREYEAKYTAERNYEILMNIYKLARETL